MKDENREEEFTEEVEIDIARREWENDRSSWEKRLKLERLMAELKGIQEERERILNIIKLRNGQLILESDEWSGSEKCQFYARINELKELKQKIKEKKKDEI